MFQEIPPPIQARMRELEAIDRQDRIDGTPRLQRMRQIPPQTGQFIAVLAALAPMGKYLEIGTSAGYSALWLSLPCRQKGVTLVTYELLEEKVRLAQETFRAAKVEDVVELVAGDALEYLPEVEDVAFCFLDAEKEIYAACYDTVIPNMVPGGLLIADNALNHRSTLQPMIDQALVDQRVDALVVPIGNGVLLSRKI